MVLREIGIYWKMEMEKWRKMKGKNQRDEYFSVLGGLLVLCVPGDCW